MELRSFTKQIEADPLLVVQEFLQPNKEWNNVQEIIQLTFKALFHTMREQSNKMKELEENLNTKASKVELSSGLMSKANVEDVKQTIEEVATNIQSRALIEDVKILMEERVSRSEFQYTLKDRVSLGEMRLAMERKLDITQFTEQVNNLFNKIDNLNKLIDYQVKTSMTINDIEELKGELNKKANIEDVNSILQQKASKESVANALKRKANITDVEAALERKTRDIERIFKQLNEKADVLKVNKIQTDLKQTYISVKENIKVNELDNIISTNLFDIHRTMAKWDAEMKLERKQLAMNLEEMNKQIERKANLNEFDELKAILDNKADIDQTAKELTNIESATNRTIMETNERISVVISKFEELKSLMQKNIEENYTDLNKLKEQLVIHEDEIKHNIDTTNKALQTIEDKIKNSTKEEQAIIKRSINELNKSLEEVRRIKVSKKELEQYNTNIEEKLNTKTSMNEVKKIIRGVQSDIEHNVVDIKNKVNDNIKELKERIEFLNNTKTDIEHIHNVLKTKVDASELDEVMVGRATIKELEQVYTKLIETNTNTKEAVSTSIEQLKVDIELLKQNNKDTINEKLLSEITELRVEIQSKVSKQILMTLRSEQDIINEALCAENCVIRWLWRSGVLKKKAIPWEIQSINTCPDNFLLEKDTTSMLIVQGGIYEISLGFFTKHKPIIRLVINSELILPLTDLLKSIVVPTKTHSKPSDKNIAGKLLSDFRFYIV